MHRATRSLCQLDPSSHAAHNPEESCRCSPSDDGGVGVCSRHEEKTTVRGVRVESRRQVPAEFFKRLGQRLYALDVRAHSKWILLSLAIGTIAGAGGVVFQFLTQAVLHYALGMIAGYSPGEPAGEHGYFASPDTVLQPWLIVPVAAIGGLLSGWLVYTFAPEAEGHGTDSAIDAFHNKRGYIRPRIPLVKTVASALTIGTGGSGGREGPIAQIGAGFGSFLGTLLKLSPRDRRIMVAAGMGAGVGAVFRAPLAGALFAAEILYSDSEFESDVVAPAAMSSITAYTVYSLTIPTTHRFLPLFGQKLQYRLHSFAELLPYAALSVVMVAGAVLYIKLFYGMHGLFKRLPVLPHLRPAIGTTLAALLGIAMLNLFRGDTRALAVLSTGYGSLQQALTDATSLGIPLLLAIALGKMLTTSLTIGSGGSGGVFGPSMVIGGCLGASVGQLFHLWWPGVVTRPETYALVGMAGFFAGAAHAPISTIIMVTEMTGDYALLLPTTLVCTLSFILCRPWKLYQKQVPSRLESAAHRGDFIVDMLEGILVREAYRPDATLILVPERMPLHEIVHVVADTQQHYFPVIDEQKRMVGIFSADDVRSYLYDQTVWPLAVASDIMVSRVVTVSPEEDLNTALRKFTSMNLDELPVVDPENRSQLLGMLRHKDLTATYNRRLAAHRQMVTEDAAALKNRW